MTLTVSPRETRLVVERNLMLLGVPTGALAAVGEVVTDAELLDLGGLAFLRTAHERDRRWGTAELAGERSARADSIAAPYAAPALLDLIVAIIAEGEGGGHSLEVHGLHEPELLGALVPQAAALGVALGIRTEGARTLLSARPAAKAGPPAYRRRAIEQGIAVDAELWWWLYHKSNEALSDDTEASRTHAGATVSPDAPPSDGDNDPDYVDPDYLPTRTKEHA